MDASQTSQSDAQQQDGQEMITVVDFYTPLVRSVDVDIVLYGCQFVEFIPKCYQSIVDGVIVSINRGRCD